MNKQTLAIGFGVAAGVGALIYFVRSRSAAGTSSTIAGGNAVASGSPQFLVPITSVNSSPTTWTTPTSSKLTNATTATTAPGTTPANGLATAAVVAANGLGSSTPSDSSMTQGFAGFLQSGYARVAAGNAAIVQYNPL